MKFIIAAEQSSTCSRASAIDIDNGYLIRAHSQFDLPVYYPALGWMEYDPVEIYSSQTRAISEAISQANVVASDISAVGIANQRGTAVIWDRETGLPIYNAVARACCRSEEICRDLKERGLESFVRDRTGQIIGTQCAGPKYSWILDHVKGAREKAQKGRLLCGTIDSWLVYCMTNGAVHITDYTNASYTMLFNLHTLEWDKDLCRELSVPIQMLPAVVSSCEQVGTYNIDGHEVPIAGIAADQQAILFGQTCFDMGQCKDTYDSDNTILVQTEEKLFLNKKGLVSTIAAGDRSKISYALEGCVYANGGILQWLRDEMRFIDDPQDADYFAEKVHDSAGVYIIPHQKEGVPWWDTSLRGAIIGITQHTNRNCLIRAALESIAYQNYTVIRAIGSVLGQRISELHVDGAISTNSFLMQLQSNISNIKVIRPAFRDITVLGAAYLAALSVGVADRQIIINNYYFGKCFTSSMSEEKRNLYLNGFDKAVRYTDLVTGDCVFG